MGFSCRLGSCFGFFRVGGRGRGFSLEVGVGVWLGWSWWTRCFDKISIGFFLMVFIILCVMFTYFRVYV